MSVSLRTVVSRAGSFVLAGVLLYFALRGVDLNALGQALRTADYRWLPPLIGVVLVSHGLRAWRWTMLLEALPEARRREVPVRTAFYSLMIGYMVNYAAPRLGEIARTANLSRHAGVGFSSTFGTVVVERILDVCTLALAFASVLVLFFDEFVAFYEMLIAPLLGSPDLAVTAAILGIALLVAAATARVVWARASRGAEADRPQWQRRLLDVAGSFRDGLATVVRSRRRVGLVGTTVVIWLCYGLMAWMPLAMLGLTRTYDLGLLDGWAIMLFGAVGVAVPSPGGAGSYHYITREVMGRMFGVPATPAATYAVLTHGAQMILYIIVGAWSLVVQGTPLRSLTREPDAVPSMPDESISTR